jgi:peptidoglycan-associated lipoprotein
MSLKSLAVAFCAVALLAGCSGKKGMMHGVDHALVRDFETNAGDRVHFEFNRSDLTKEAKTTLNRQSEWLKAHPTIRVSVQGHCDERGTREYNLALGERRAEAAKKALAANGISAERLETVSYGKERPAVLGNDEAAYAKNRRAVSVLQR